MTGRPRMRTWTLLVLEQDDDGRVRTFHAAATAVSCADALTKAWERVAQDRVRYHVEAIPKEDTTPC